MKVQKLLHTRMRVNDIERTVKFYEQALELKVARRSTSPRGAQIVFLATPNSEEEIEICQMPPGAPAVVVQPAESSLHPMTEARLEQSVKTAILESKFTAPHVRAM